MLKYLICSWHGFSVSTVGLIFRIVSARLFAIKFVYKISLTVMSYKMSKYTLEIMMNFS